MDSGISADVAEAEEAPPESIQEKYDSLTEAKPQGSLSMNAAETPMEAASAPAPESRAAAEWKLYAGLDHTFADCSESTNHEARTATLRQFIEKRRVS